MSYFKDNDFMPCIQLYSELKGANYSGIEDLCLASFTSFKETGRSKLVQDGIAYLLRCIEHKFSPMFFHYYVTHILSKSNKKFEIFEGMKYRDILGILTQAFEDLTNEFNQENFSYVKLSQLLQMSIYVRSESNSNKLRAYDIEYSPFKFYILELGKKVYILTPFDLKNEWRDEVPETKFITTAYVDWIEQQAVEGTCEQCKIKCKFISCIKFHRQCIACISTSFCDDCNESDCILNQYYIKKRLREPADNPIVNNPKNNNDLNRPKVENERRCCGIF